MISGFGALALAAALLGTACGAPSAPSSSPAPPQTTRSPSASPPISRAAAMALTVADIPPSSTPFTQISDALLNSVSDTDQRLFATSDDSFRIEDDVFIAVSSTAATADFATWLDGAKKNVTTITEQPALSGLGSQAAELVGTATGGNSVVTISWQEGPVLLAVLLERSGASVDPRFAESIARNQDGRVKARG